MDGVEEEEEDELTEYEETDGAEIVGEDWGNIRVENEAEVIRKIKSPMTPSAEAVEEHWIGGRVICRGWCEVCVCVASWDCTWILYPKG